MGVRDLVKDLGPTGGPALTTPERVPLVNINREKKMERVAESV